MSECRVIDEGTDRVHHCGRCPYEDDCQYFQQLSKVREVHEEDDWLGDADLDQLNPVDCDAETWAAIYAENPDLLY